MSFSSDRASYTIGRLAYRLCQFDDEIFQLQAQAINDPDLMEYLQVTAKEMQERLQALEAFITEMAKRV
jgi:phage-related protein